MNIIKRAGIIFLMASCVSCSSAPRVAPRFTPPSTVPIHQSADRVAKHLDDAQQTVGKIAFAKSIDAAKPYILKLRGEITAAQKEVVYLKGETNTLDVKLKEQTKKANKLATDYDNSQRDLAKANAIVKQVNSWGGLGAIVYGIKRLAIRLAIGATGLIVVWVVVIAFGGGPVLAVGLQTVGGIFLRVVTAGRSTASALESFKR